MFVSEFMGGNHRNYSIYFFLVSTDTDGTLEH